MIEKFKYSIRTSLYAVSCVYSDVIHLLLCYYLNAWLDIVITTLYLLFNILYFIVNHPRKCKVSLIYFFSLCSRATLALLLVFVKFRYMLRIKLSNTCRVVRTPGASQLLNAMSLSTARYHVYISWSMFAVQCQHLPRNHFLCLHLTSFTVTTQYKMMLK